MTEIYLILYSLYFIYNFFNYKIMESLSNEENNINSNLENSNSSPEGITHPISKTKNFLPSFLFENTEKGDDYFNDPSSNDENYSSEEKEINDNIKENGNEDKKQFDQNNIFKINNEEKINKKENNNKNDNNNNINKRIINNNMNYNINRNFNNQKLYNSMTINNNNQKNFINNSFNNLNSNYYFQNYFNLSNISNINSNFLNNTNEKNIINFINQNPSIIPYSNSFSPMGQIYQFNTLLPNYFYTPINKSNNSFDNFNNLNYMKNNQNTKDIKYSSFNKPFSPLQNISLEKKKNKKTKKNKNEENNIDSNNITIKKLLSMTDISLYNYLITQKGSRDMQIALKKIKENEAEILIDKLKDYISDITIDKYGNYFSQKLIQVCVPSQRIKILKNINSRFVEISNNSFGTHPLQTLMEIINMSEEKKIVLSLIIGNELILSLDSKGTHVLQKFISNTIDEEREQLNKNIINLIEKLIVDPFGVCVLIKLVKHTKDKSITKRIANYVTDNGPLSFIQHPYANYAVQILINSTDLSYCENIIETIVNNYLSLSMQKFSSNVVENCIKYGDEVSVKKIYKAIIEQEKLESLLNNSYGNFVLEKLISRLNKEEKSKLIKKIEKLGKSKILTNTLRNLLYE